MVKQIEYDRNLRPLRRHLVLFRYGDPLSVCEIAHINRKVHKSISGLEKALARSSHAFLVSGANASVRMSTMRESYCEIVASLLRQGLWRFIEMI